jgi:hypothetical protein
MSDNTDIKDELQEDTGFAIEIVDDTPEKDRGRPNKVDVKEPSEEEMDNYSEGVKKRFSQLTAKYHAERRSKEAIEREHNEAIAYASKIAEENRQLAKLVAESQKNLANAAKLKAEAEVERAKSHYKQAYEAGDADKIVEAQETMARAVAEQEQWRNFRPVEAPEERVAPQPQRPRIDPKAADWAKRNEWFGSDKEMTGTAYGIHERLVRDEGMDPTSDEYYQTIDTEMRKRYPDRFESEQEEVERPQRQAVRKTSAVAPVSRSVKQPRKVTLTTTQVALARRLGITPEQYAAQIAKEMQNG